MAKLELPQDVKLATRMLEVESEARARGWLGIVFGDRHNAPSNIGAAAVILGIAGLVLVAFCPMPDTTVRGRMIELFGAIVIGALGYVFGSRTGSRS